MSALLDKIKADHRAARLARDSATVTALTTFLGEVDTASKKTGQELTDGEVVKLVKKFIDGIDEMIQHATKSSDFVRLQEATLERATFAKYQPKQYVGTELQSIVALAVQATAATKMKDMGSVMKYLNTNYEGQFNGNDASFLVKSVLS